MKIPKNIQNNKTIKLKKQKLSLINSKKSNTIFIQLHIKIPTLTKKNNKTLNKLKNINTYPQNNTYKLTMKKQIK